MSNKVTFKDVAKLAGVSTQTVSRVTNGGANVNPETLKKVQQAIDELGYVPNKGAQLLVRKSTKTFGVISLPMFFQGAAGIVSGIRVECEKVGYSMSLAVADSEEASLEAAIREFKSQQVEAILFNLPVATDVAERLNRKHDMPFLFIDVLPETQVSQVSADHYGGARAMADLMLAQGRQRFALIAGPSHSHAANLRLMAWSDSINEAGLSVVAKTVGDWSAESGYVETRKLLAHANRIDVLLLGNDQMALGALRACAEFNIAVPEQIAVAGFDDTLNSEYFNPPLTTVHQDFAEIGHLAVQKVLELLDDDMAQISKLLVPTVLVERLSTAPVIKSKNPIRDIELLLQEVQQKLSSIS